MSDYSGETEPAVRRFSRRDFLKAGVKTAIALTAATSPLAGLLLSRKPEITSGEFLGQTRKARQNLREFFMDRDVGNLDQAIANPQARKDELTAGAFFPPMLDRLVLGLAEEATARLLQENPMIEMKKLQYGIMEYIYKSEWHNLFYLLHVYRFINPAEIALRWSTALSFEETDAPKSLSREFREPISRYQHDFPLPIKIRENPDSFSHVGEYVYLSDDQLQAVTDLASRLLSQDGINVDSTELNAKVAEIIALHEIGHGLDILANRQIAAYLPKNHDLHGVYDARLRAARISEIRASDSRAPQTEIEAFKSRSILYMLKNDVTDPDKFIESTLAYGVNLMANAARRSSTIESGYEGDVVCRYIKDVLGEIKVGRMELSDPSWLGRLTEKQRNSPPVKLIEAVYGDDVFILNRINEKQNGEVFDADDIARIIADRATDLIFSGKFTGEIDINVLREMYWEIALHASIETFAEKACAYLYYKSHPEEAGPELLKGLENDAVANYLGLLFRSLGNSETNKLIQGIAAVFPENLRTGIARNPTLRQIV